MSDAIRCGECRWWDKVDPDSIHASAGIEGFCELNPPMWIDSETGWYQPETLQGDGCSHGERRPESEPKPCQ